MNTLYSTIYDLKNLIIYVYYFHQFDEVVSLDVMNEIHSIDTRVSLESMFSNELIERSNAEQTEYEFYDHIGNMLEVLGVLLVIIAVYYIYKRLRRNPASV